MKPRSASGLTLLEAMVCIVLLVILALLAVPSFSSGSGGRNGPTQALSNLRQLHLATFQMALDGVTAKEPGLGWPGDTGGTYLNWARKLLEGQYLTTNDFVKLLSGSGIRLPAGEIPRMEETAVRVYAVGSNSPGEAVFLTSANFTNTPFGGEPLRASSKPYLDRFFVVMRKDGDGTILLARHVGQTNLIGAFAPLCR